jgi:hypothetical protein
MAVQPFIEESVLCAKGIGQAGLQVADQNAWTNPAITRLSRAFGEGLVGATQLRPGDRGRPGRRLENSGAWSLPFAAHKYSPWLDRSWLTSSVTSAPLAA